MQHAIALAIGLLIVGAAGMRLNSRLSSAQGSAHASKDGWPSAQQHAAPPARESDTLKVVRWRVGQKIADTSNCSFGELFYARDILNPTESLVVKIVGSRSLGKRSLGGFTLEASLMLTGGSLEREAAIMERLRGEEGFIQLKKHFGPEDLEALGKQNLRIMLLDSGMESTHLHDLVNAIFPDSSAGKRIKKEVVHMFFMENGGRRWDDEKDKDLLRNLQALVQHMHNLHIYHLDLKVGNVMVQEGLAVQEGIGMRLQVWEVIGGVKKGGIIVKTSESVKSNQTEERLSTGALVLETERRGNRLKYQLLMGSGPAEGWVSVEIGETKKETKKLLTISSVLPARWQAPRNTVEVAVAAAAGETLKKIKIIDFGISLWAEYNDDWSFQEFISRAKEFKKKPHGTNMLDGAGFFERVNQVTDVDDLDDSSPADTMKLLEKIDFKGLHDYFRAEMREDS